MDTDIRWIHVACEKYIARNSAKPIAISDWHNEDDNLMLPWDILRIDSKERKNDIIRYMFYDSNIENKKHIIKYFSYYFDYNLISKNFTITQNSTASLYLSIRTLCKFGCRNFLVISPVYFSITSTIKSLNCNCVYYHLGSSDGFSVDYEKIIEFVENQYIECVILTDPIFCTGISYDKGMLDYLVSVLNEKGCWIIIDKTLNGLEWFKEEYMLLENHDSMAMSGKSVIVIDSPTKKLFLNGIKHGIVFSQEECGGPLGLDSSRGGIS